MSIIGGVSLWDSDDFIPRVYPNGEKASHLSEDATDIQIIHWGTAPYAYSDFAEEKGWPQGIYPWLSAYLPLGDLIGYNERSLWDSRFLIKFNYDIRLLRAPNADPPVTWYNVIQEVSPTMGVTFMFGTDYSYTVPSTIDPNKPWRKYVNAYDVEIFLRLSISAQRQSNQDTNGGRPALYDIYQNVMTDYFRNSQNQTIFAGTVSQPPPNAYFDWGQLFSPQGTISFGWTGTTFFITFGSYGLTFSPVFKNIPYSFYTLYMFIPIPVVSMQIFGGELDSICLDAIAANTVAVEQTSNCGSINFSIPVPIVHDPPPPEDPPPDPSPPLPPNDPVVGNPSPDPVYPRLFKENGVITTCPLNPPEGYDPNWTGFAGYIFEAPAVQGLSGYIYTLTFRTASIPLSESYWPFSIAAIVRAKDLQSSSNIFGGAKVRFNYPYIAFYPVGHVNPINTDDLQISDEMLRSGMFKIEVIVFNNDITARLYVFRDGDLTPDTDPLFSWSTSLAYDWLLEAADQVGFTVWRSKPNQCLDITQLKISALSLDVSIGDSLYGDDALSGNLGGKIIVGDRVFSKHFDVTLKPLAFRLNERLNGIEVVSRIRKIVETLTGIETIPTPGRLLEVLEELSADDKEFVVNLVSLLHNASFQDVLKREFPGIDIVGILDVLSIAVEQESFSEAFSLGDRVVVWKSGGDLNLPPDVIFSPKRKTLFHSIQPRRIR